jgi:hypothetical protein
MCWFLQLVVTPQGKSREAEERVCQAANNAGLVLQGEFPTLMVTDGHCSCKFIQKGHSIVVCDLIEEVVKADKVKFVLVGWSWSEKLRDDAPTERLSLPEFQERNQSGLLKKDSWYRVNDAAKYSFHHSQERSR